MADIPAEMDSAYNSSEFPPTDPAANRLALTSVAMLQRSNSAIAFKSQRKQHLHWLQRSLPPAKRERRGEKAKSSGTPKEECTAGLSTPRSKSMNFKRSTAGPSTPPRSLSFASGSRVRRARRAKEDTDAELGFLEFHQLYRRGSIRSILPIMQQIKYTKSQKWTITIFSLVVAILASVRGFTLAFSSNTTLDLTGDAQELPSSYFFSMTLISIFAVR